MDSRLLNAGHGALVANGELYYLTEAEPSFICFFVFPRGGKIVILPDPAAKSARFQSAATSKGDAP
jgi:hypothetical protein